MDDYCIGHPADLIARAGEVFLEGARPGALVRE
jgi:hypothetical protein